MASAVGALVTFACVYLACTYVTRPSCRQRDGDTETETALAVGQNGLVKVLIGTPFRSLQLAPTTAARGIVLFHNPATRSVSFVPRVGDDAYGRDVMIVGGRNVAWSVHPGRREDHGHVPAECDGMFGLASPRDPTDNYPRAWESHALRCSTLLLGPGDRRRWSDECTDPAGRTFAAAADVAIERLPVCMAAPGEPGRRRECFRACFALGASHDETRVPAGTLGHRFDRRTVELTLHGQPEDDDRGECECVSQGHPLAVTHERGLVRAWTSAEASANASCDVVFGRDALTGLSLQYDAETRRLSVSECPHCSRWEGDATIALFVLVAVLLAWVAVVAPHRVCYETALLTAMLLQLYGHFSALGLTTIAAVGRDNGNNVRGAAAGDCSAATVDALVCAFLLVTTALNVALIARRIAVYWNLAAASGEDGGREMARAFERMRVYHRFLFEACMLTAIWYCSFETREYTMRALYVSLASAALCIDVTALAASAALVECPGAVAMMATAGAVDALVTRVAVTPLLALIVPCRIATFPVSVLYALLAVTGPALVLATLGLATRRPGRRCACPSQ